MENKAYSAGPLDRDVKPAAYAVFADNGNIRIWSKSPAPLDTGEFVPLYQLPSGPTPDLIDAVCRATLMSKTTAEYAVLAVLGTLKALTPNA